MEEIKSITDMLEINSESLQEIDPENFANPKKESDEFEFGFTKRYPILSPKRWINKRQITTHLRTSPLRLFHRHTTPKLFIPNSFGIITRTLGNFTYIFSKVWGKTTIKKV